MKRRLAMAMALAAYLVLALSLTVTAAPPSPQATSAFDQKILSQVSISRMMDNLKMLAVDIGVRVAGSPEDTRAGDFIKGTLDKYGYDSQFQSVPTVNNYVAYLRMVTPTPRNIWVWVGNYPSATPPLTAAGGITGQVVDCGLGDLASDFPSGMTGKIAFVRRAAPGATSDTAVVTQKIRNAQAAGASAVLIQNYDWHRFRATTGGDTSITIPFATMNNEAGVMVQAGGTANFQINYYVGSRNVIATRKAKEGIDTGKVIVVSGHYDSVPTSPGANDNGTGTVITMELARVFSSLLLDTEVRFALWAGEEGGLRGSRYYVSQLSAEEKARHLAVFNMDLTGGSWPDGNKLWVLTQDKDNPNVAGYNLVSDQVFATLERMGLRGSEMDGGIGWRPGSDQVSFYEAGIKDGANISWRKNDIPGAGLGMEPEYHEPHDSYELNVGPDRLKLGAQVVGASVYDIARPDTPNLSNSAIVR